MARIGAFTRGDDSSFTGMIRALNINVKATIKPVAKDNERSPDYRIAANGVELGAGRSKAAKDTGAEYVSVKFDEAARSEMTLREALGFMVSREIARRDERRISMASKIAQFPFVRELEGFDWSAQPSLDPRQIRELATCRWIAHGDTT